MDVKKRLDELYLKPSSVGSLGGVDRLYHAAKSSGITRKQVVCYLQAKDGYNQHKPVRKKFKRRKIICAEINDQHQIDLADMQKFSDDNNDIKYLLTIVDCFSRFGWAIPVKSKKPESIIPALDRVYKEVGPPLRCQSDNGKEFVGKKVKELFRDWGITFFTTKNDDIKCVMVERLNRTIKERLWLYMTENNTYRYIDVLDDVMTSYNSSVHSSTGFAPSKIGKAEGVLIRQELIENQLEAKNLSPFQIGDHVRVSKRKKTFEKGYETNYNELLYKVTRIAKKGNMFQYEVEDLAGEKVDGWFYAQELSRVILIERPYHRVSQILKERVHKGKLQYLVRWYGYSSAFDSWEYATDLK